LKVSLGFLFQLKEKAVVIQQHQHSPVTDMWYIAMEAVSELQIRGQYRSHKVSEGQTFLSIHLEAESGLYVNKKESKLSFPSSKRCNLKILNASLVLENHLQTFFKSLPSFRAAVLA